LAVFQVENGVNDAGSERGRALAEMRARRVALSGTSNTVDLLVIENARGLDQSLEFRRAHAPGVVAEGQGLGRQVPVTVDGRLGRRTADGGDLDFVAGRTARIARPGKAGRVLRLHLAVGRGRLDDQGIGGLRPVGTRAERAEQRRQGDREDDSFPMKFHVGAPRKLTKTYKRWPVGVASGVFGDAFAFVSEKRCPIPNYSTAHQLICGKFPLEIKDFSRPSRKSNACMDNFAKEYFQKYQGRFLTEKTVWKL
jgi:hypothetical protein